MIESKAEYSKKEVVHAFRSIEEYMHVYRETIIGGKDPIEMISSELTAIINGNDDDELEKNLKSKIKYSIYYDFECVAIYIACNCSSNEEIHQNIHRLSDVQYITKKYSLRITNLNLLSDLFISRLKEYSGKESLPDPYAIADVRQIKKKLDAANVEIECLKVEKNAWKSMYLNNYLSNTPTKVSSTQFLINTTAPTIRQYNILSKVENR